MTFSLVFSRKFSLLLSLLLLSSMSLSAAGITFFEGSWEETLAEAKAQRKLVFVDAYTTWCGPCKAMSRNTFPDEAVGAFFNEEFVSYKFDMEKGEGPRFAAKYGIMAYPSLLFLNYKGEVVHKVVGYRSPKQLLNEGRKAASPENTQEQLSLEYEDGSDDPEVLYHFAMGQYEAGKAYAKPAESYFASQEDKDLLSEKNWKAIEAFTQDPNSREFQYLLAKQKKFMKRYGIQAVADKLYTVLRQETLSAALTNQEAGYLNAIEIANNSIKDKGQTASALRMLYAETKKDWLSFSQKALHHFDTFIIIQPKALDHAARLFALHIDDPELLAKALEWSRQSVAIENESYNNDTHARLLYQLGQYEEAMKFANKALRIAILNEEETAEKERFIDSIQKKLR